MNVLGNGLFGLFRHPTELARLRADVDGLLPTAVEELIRYDSPLQLFERTAYDDVEIGGVTIRRGQKIAALLGSAHRDPSVFAVLSTPEVGSDPDPHLGFGAGSHLCLGAPLAQQPNFVIRGLRSLRVRW